MAQKLAVLNAEIVLTADGSNPQSRIQLLPDGQFRGIDGRPTDVPHWILNSTNGFNVAQLANVAENDLVIDYEHQTVNAKNNGQPAPAAGWIKHVEYIPGKGLFADVTWTAKATAMINAKEYRYVSAVFAYDINGYVLKLAHAAITNFPALDGMDELIAACSQKFTTDETNNMDEILKLLRQLFKMPDANETQLQAALTALATSQPAEVALSAVFTTLSEQNQKIAALSAQASNPDPAKIAALSAQASNPDPAKLVPIELMQSLHQQVAVLTAQLQNKDKTEVIDKALSEGKLLPAQKQWATDLAATPAGLAQLKSYLDTVSGVAALSGEQQGAANAAAEKTITLTSEDKEAAKALGYSEAEYLEIVKKGGK